LFYLLELFTNASYIFLRLFHITIEDSCFAVRLIKSTARCLATFFGLVQHFFGDIHLLFCLHAPRRGVLRIPLPSFVFVFSGCQGIPGFFTLRLCFL
jgi:hypothetical protein